MNIPNRASVHHFIRRVFFASVSFGSWANEDAETHNRHKIKVMIEKILVFIESNFGVQV
jgi:hypothetical protein